jgi:hypothetical protein
VRRWRPNAEDRLRALERAAATGDPVARDQLGVELVRAGLAERALEVLGHEGGLRLFGEDWGHLLIDQGAYVEPPEILHDDPVVSALRDGRRYNGSVILATGVDVASYEGTFEYHGPPAPFLLDISPGHLSHATGSDLAHSGGGGWTDPYWDIVPVPGSSAPMGPDMSHWVHGPSYNDDGRHETQNVWVLRSLAYPEHP